MSFDAGEDEGPTRAVLQQQASVLRDLPLHQGPLSPFAYPPGLLPGDGLWCFLQPCPDPNRPLEVKHLEVLVPPTAVFPGDATPSAPFLLTPGSGGAVHSSHSPSETAVGKAMSAGDFQDDVIAVARWSQYQSASSGPAAAAVLASVEFGPGLVTALQFAKPAASGHTPPRRRPPQPSAKAPDKVRLHLPPGHDPRRSLQGLYQQHRTAVAVLAAREVRGLAAHGLATCAHVEGEEEGGGVLPTPSRSLQVSPSASLGRSPTAGASSGGGGGGTPQGVPRGAPPLGVGFQIQKLLRCRGASPFIVRAVWRAGGCGAPSSAWVLSSSRRYADESLGELGDALAAAMQAADKADGASGSAAFLRAVQGGGHTSKAGAAVGDIPSLKRAFRRRLQEVLLVNTGHSNDASSATPLPPTVQLLQPRGRGLPTPLSTAARHLAQLAQPPLTTTVRAQSLSVRGAEEVMERMQRVVDHVRASGGLRLTEFIADWTRDEAGNWWLLAPKAYRVRGRLQGLGRLLRAPPAPPSIALIPAAKAVWVAQARRILSLGGQRAGGVRDPTRAHAANLQQVNLLAEEAESAGVAPAPADALLAPPTSVSDLRRQARQRAASRPRTSYKPRHAASPEPEQLVSSGSSSDGSASSGEEEPYGAGLAALLHSRLGTTPASAAAAGVCLATRPSYPADLQRLTRRMRREWVHAASRSTKANRASIGKALQGATSAQSTGLAPTGSLAASTTGWGRTRPGVGGHSTLSLRSLGSTPESAPALSIRRGTVTLGGVTAGSTVQYGTLMAGHVLQQHMPPLGLTPPGQAFAAAGGMLADVHTSALARKRPPSAGAADATNSVQDAQDSDVSGAEEEIVARPGSGSGRHSTLRYGAHEESAGKGHRGGAGVAVRRGRALPPPVLTASPRDLSGTAQGARHATKPGSASVPMAMPRHTGSHSQLSIDLGPDAALGIGGRPLMRERHAAPAATVAGQDTAQEALKLLLADRTVARRSAGADAGGQDGTTCVSIVEGMEGEEEEGPLAPPPKVRGTFRIAEHTLRMVGALHSAVQGAVANGAFAKSDEALTLFARSGVADMGGTALTHTMARHQLQAVHDHLLRAMHLPGSDKGLTSSTSRKDVSSRLRREARDRPLRQADLEALEEGPAAVEQPCAMCGLRNTNHRLPFHLTQAQQAWLVLRLARRLPPQALQSRSWLRRHLVLLTQQLMAVREVLEAPHSAATAESEHSTPSGKRRGLSDTQPPLKQQQPWVPQGSVGGGGAALLASPLARPGDDAGTEAWQALDLFTAGDFALAAAHAGGTASADPRSELDSAAPQGAAQPKLLLLHEARRALSLLSAPSGPTAARGSVPLRPDIIAGKYRPLAVCALCFELHEREVLLTSQEAAMSATLGVPRSVRGLQAPPPPLQPSIPLASAPLTLIRLVLCVDGVVGLPTGLLVGQGGTAPPSDTRAQEQRLSLKASELQLGLAKAACRNAELTLRACAVRVQCLRDRLKRVQAVVEGGGDVDVWWKKRGALGEEAKARLEELPAALTHGCSHEDEAQAALAALETPTDTLLDAVWPHAQREAAGDPPPSLPDRLPRLQSTPRPWSAGRPKSATSHAVTGHALVQLPGSAVGRARSTTPQPATRTAHLAQLFAEAGKGREDEGVALVHTWLQDLVHVSRLLDVLERSWQAAAGKVVAAEAEVGEVSRAWAATQQRLRYRALTLRLRLWRHQWDVPLQTGTALAASLQPQDGAEGSTALLPPALDVPVRKVFTVYALAPSTPVDRDVPVRGSAGLSRALQAQAHVEGQLLLTQWRGAVPGEVEGGWETQPIGTLQLPLAAHRHKSVPSLRHRVLFQECSGKGTGGPSSSRETARKDVSDIHSFIAPAVEGKAGGGSGGGAKPPPPDTAPPARGIQGLAAARRRAALRHSARLAAKVSLLVGGLRKEVSSDGPCVSVEGGGSSAAPPASEPQPLLRTVPGGAAALQWQRQWGSRGAEEDPSAGLDEAHVVGTSSLAASFASTRARSLHLCSLMASTACELLRDDIVPSAVDPSLLPPGGPEPTGVDAADIKAATLRSPTAVGRTSPESAIGRTPSRWQGWVWVEDLGLYLASRLAATRGFGAVPLSPALLSQLPHPDEGERALAQACEVAMQVGQSQPPVDFAMSEGEVGAASGSDGAGASGRTASGTSTSSGRLGEIELSSSSADEATASAPPEGLVAAEARSLSTASAVRSATAPQPKAARSHTVGGGVADLSGRKPRRARVQSAGESHLHRAPRRARSGWSSDEGDETPDGTVQPPHRPRWTQPPEGWDAQAATPRSDTPRAGEGRASGVARRLSLYRTSADGEASGGLRQSPRRSSVEQIAEAVAEAKQEVEASAAGGASLGPWRHLAPGHAMPAALLSAQLLALARHGRVALAATQVAHHRALLQAVSRSAPASPQRRPLAVLQDRQVVSPDSLHPDIQATLHRAAGDTARPTSPPDPTDLAPSLATTLSKEIKGLDTPATPALLSGVRVQWTLTLTFIRVRGRPDHIATLRQLGEPRSPTTSFGSPGRRRSMTVRRNRSLLLSVDGIVEDSDEGDTGGEEGDEPWQPAQERQAPARLRTTLPKAAVSQAPSPTSRFVSAVRQAVALREGLRTWVRRRRGEETAPATSPGRRPLKKPGTPPSPLHAALGGPGWRHGEGVASPAMRGSPSSASMKHQGSSWGMAAQHSSSMASLTRGASSATLRNLRSSSRHAVEEAARAAQDEPSQASAGPRGVVALSRGGPIDVTSILQRYGAQQDAMGAACDLALSDHGDLLPAHSPELPLAVTQARSASGSAGPGGTRLHVAVWGSLTELRLEGRHLSSSWDSGSSGRRATQRDAEVAFHKEASSASFTVAATTEDMARWLSGQQVRSLGEFPDLTVHRHVPASSFGSEGGFWLPPAEAGSPRQEAGDTLSLTQAIGSGLDAPRDLLFTALLPEAERVVAAVGPPGQGAGTPLHVEGSFTLTGQLR